MARIAGDEFAALLSDTGVEGARATADAALYAAKRRIEPHASAAR